MYGVGRRDVAVDGGFGRAKFGQALKSGWNNWWDEWLP